MEGGKRSRAGNLRKAFEKKSSRDKNKGRKRKKEKRKKTWSENKRIGKREDKEENDQYRKREVKSSQLYIWEWERKIKKKIEEGDRIGE